MQILIHKHENAVEEDIVGFAQCNLSNVILKKSLEPKDFKKAVVKLTREARKREFQSY